MARRINSTPKKDGFRMPGEFEEQEQIFMMWPERDDTWRNGGKPAQMAFAEVARAISEFEPVTMIVSMGQYENARNRLPEEIRVVEMSNDDAWVRDCGPSFVINDEGVVRGNDWDFNAWGGLVDGLYFPWDSDDAIAQKICELERVDSYKVDGFVFEGGSFHVDGEGTVITTEQCLLSEGRNPHMTKEEIEETVKEYLNCEKVIWLPEGIDPEETNGHVDDIACYIAPGEVAVVYTDDETHPWYKACQSAYETLCNEVDAKGRKLKVHKITTAKHPVTLPAGFDVDVACGAPTREEGDYCNASYMNFLICNGGVIVPQYGDENDALALEQIQALFPDRKAVGVNTVEVVYGGGNIHCITQQMPKRRKY